MTISSDDNNDKENLYFSVDTEQVYDLDLPLLDIKTGKTKLKKFPENKKNVQIPLTPIEKEVFVGIMLGDGHLRTQNGKTYNLMYEQAYQKQVYFMHVYSFFFKWVLTEARPGYIRKDKFGTIRYNLKFATCRTPEMSYYGKLFYDGKKKIVPKTIETMLTPRALAFWYMDDGSIKSKEHKGVYYNTQGFTLKEIEFLCEILNRKFDLNCLPIRERGKRAIAKDQYQIFVHGSCYEIFRDLVFEFLIPEMYYKFPVPRKRPRLIKKSEK